MNKKIFQLCLILFLALPPGSGLAQYLSPDYKVTLKKGTVFFVADFEVGGESISLFSNGDILRVPKKSVRHIRPTFRPVSGVRSVAKSISFLKGSDLNTTVMAAEMEGREKAWAYPLEIVEDQGLRAEVKATMEAKKAAKAQFKALIRARKTEETQEVRQRILGLQVQLSVLLEEAKKANDGAVPSWWGKLIPD